MTRLKAWLIMKPKIEYEIRAYLTGEGNGTVAYRYTIWEGSECLMSGDAKTLEDAYVRAKEKALYWQERIQKIDELDKFKFRGSV